METKSIITLILVFIMVGVIIGIGVIVFSNLGTIAKNDVSKTNETVTVTSQAATLANDDVTAVSRIRNATSGAKSCTKINVAKGCLNWTSVGGVTLNSTYNNGAWHIDYSYLEDSATTGVMSNMVTTVGSISSTWLVLIVTVMCLGIVLSIVVSSFAGKKR